MSSLEEDAAITEVAGEPGFAAPGQRDEGVGEISGGGVGERGEGVERLRGVEATFGGEAEERRRVAFAVATEEGATGDDGAETGAGGGGAGERGRGGQAEEDLQDLVDKVRHRGGHGRRRGGLRSDLLAAQGRQSSSGSRRWL